MNELYGKIIYFDGYDGYVMGYDKKRYSISADNIKEDQTLKVGDYIKFVPDIYEGVEHKEYVAVNIEPLIINNDEKTNQTKGI